MTEQEHGVPETLWDRAAALRKQARLIEREMADKVKGLRDEADRLCPDPDRLRLRLTPGRCEREDEHEAHTFWHNGRMTNDYPRNYWCEPRID